MRKPLDPRAWAIWLLATAVIILLARNPLYLVILLLVVQIVGKVCAQPGLGLHFSIWRFGAIIIFFSVLFNMLMVHIGQMVLFRLPVGWPLLGGIITLEAAVFGAVNGLLLLTLLALFMTFNNIVSPADLVRLIPRAFQSVGVVLLIALTYVPETTRYVRRIQEAQAIRGHRMHGLRDWRPIVLPLLVGGLERSLNLAETMVARGYGATAVSTHSTLYRVGLLVGLLAGFSGWALTFWVGWPGYLVMASGFLLLGWMFWSLGRETPHTHYRRQKWSWRDSVVVATAIIPLLLVTLPMLPVDQISMTYSPYPQLSWPVFDPLIGLSMLLLVTPALLAEFGEDNDRD